MAAASRRRGCIDRRSRRSRRRSRRARASRSASSSISGSPICRTTSPNIRAENGPADAHVRIGWFRAVSNNFHAFAAHSFADEMAQAARPRLARVPARPARARARCSTSRRRAWTTRTTARRIDKYPIDTRRLRRVLEIAGEKSGWGKRKSGGGWGMGIAAHRSFNTYVASVVEVEVDGRGRLQGAAHRAGRRRRRDRQSRSRAVADGRRGGDGRRPGADRARSPRRAAGSSRATSTTSRWRA